jgi:dihydroorotate dehydrogenase
LRDLQNADDSARLLERLRREQLKLSVQHGRHVPIAFKVAPDLHPDHIDALADVFVQGGLECLIATNTTLERQAVMSDPLHAEAGGLSGPPVRDLSTAVISQFAQRMGARVPIIGVGGIASVQDAQEKFDAGACLVQLYTSFIYQGPALVRALVREVG